MTKSNPIFIGDRVRTKKGFKPFLANENIFDPKGELYEGTVLDKRGKYLVIDFGKELPFTHLLENKLQKPTGYAVQFKHLDVIETFVSDDKKEQAYVNLMQEYCCLGLQEIPIKIRSLEDRLEDKVSAAKRLALDLDKKEIEIEKTNHELVETIKKKGALKLDVTKILKQYKKLISNKKIKDVEVLDRDGKTVVLVTTKDLTYTNPDSIIEDYVLGAYKILIPMDNNDGIMAINYKRHQQKFKYHHPCIHNGIMCLGNTVGEEIRKHRNESNLVNIIYLLIMFLEKPNYGSPHTPEQDFLCAQEVTINPTNQLDWFSYDYWTENEQWDGDRFIADFKEKNKDAIKCDNCGRMNLSSQYTCRSCEHEL